MIWSFVHFSLNQTLKKGATDEEKEDFLKEAMLMRLVKCRARNTC